MKAQPLGSAPSWPRKAAWRRRRKRKAVEEDQEGSGGRGGGGGEGRQWRKAGEEEGSGGAGGRERRRRRMRMRMMRRKAAVSRAAHRPAAHSRTLELAEVHPNAGPPGGAACGSCWWLTGPWDAPLGSLGWGNGRRALAAATPGDHDTPALAGFTHFLSKFSPREKHLPVLSLGLVPVERGCAQRGRRAPLPARQGLLCAAPPGRSPELLTPGFGCLLWSNPANRGRSRPAARGTSRAAPHPSASPCKVRHTG